MLRCRSRSFYDMIFLDLVSIGLAQRDFSEKFFSLLEFLGGEQPQDSWHKYAEGDQVQFLIFGHAACETTKCTAPRQFLGWQIRLTAVAVEALLAQQDEGSWV
jgi:hypothetical protein